MGCQDLLTDPVVIHVNALAILPPFKPVFPLEGWK